MSILDEVFDYLQEPHRYERYIVCRCAFHSPDERPSMFVYEDKYFCKSCGAFGDTNKLLEKLDGSPVRYQPKPKNFHNPWNKWIEQFGSIENTLIHAHQYIQKHPSEYLSRRAIPYEYQLKAKLGMLDGFYLFPIKDRENKVISGVARAGEDMNQQNKYILPAHHDPSLLYVPSWRLVVKSDYVFMTYGICDALSIAILGYPAFSTTTGRNLIASTLDWCRKSIHLIPDAGEEIDAMRFIAQLGWRGHVIKINWPSGTKDVNDLAIHYPDLLQEELRKYCGTNMERYQ